MHKTPRERRREATLARILDAALDLVVEGGFDALSMNRLARETDFTPGALYRYFDSKQALLEQIVRTYAGRALTAPAEIPTEPSLQQGLRLAAEQMIVNFQRPEHITFMRFLFQV